MRKGYRTIYGLFILLAPYHDKAYDYTPNGVGANNGSYQCAYKRNEWKLPIRTRSLNSIFIMKQVNDLTNTKQQNSHYKTFNRRELSKNFRRELSLVSFLEKSLSKDFRRGLSLDSKENLGSP